MKTRGYTTFTIVTTILELLALAAIMRFLLPVFGVAISDWGFAAIMIAFTVYNCVTYRICRNTMSKKAPLPIEAMIGRSGRTTTPLIPEGIVQVGTERWKARAISSIDKNEEIVVVDTEGLTLVVTRSHIDHGSHEILVKTGRN